MLLNDVRYALRLMRRNVGFTTVAVLSLALGIGANTAIFSLFYTIMLRQLPVAHPEELVELTRRNADQTRNDGYWGWEKYEYLREHNRFSQTSPACHSTISLPRTCLVPSRKP